MKEVENNMELVIAIASFLLGYFAQKIMDYIFEKVIKKKRYLQNKKAVNRHQLEFANGKNDILMLATGNPCFSSYDIDIRVNMNNVFYIAFPEELLCKTTKNIGKFSKKDRFFFAISIEDYTEEELTSIINASRYKIANEFVKREDGLYFNGMKYGIKYADGFSRTCDDIEKPLLTIELFLTDHFTHRVLSDVIDNLDIQPSKLSFENLNREFNWMRTSLGLSIIIILKSTNQILMTRRAKNASFSEGKSWIYVSATEAFTETDFDRYTNSPDLLLCTKRAVLEELGITAKMYNEDSIKFYDMFFETHFHQDGIVVSMELNNSVTFEMIKDNFASAKDSFLEVEQLFLLDNNVSSIKRYLEVYKHEMRSQTVFALKSYLTRL